VNIANGTVFTYPYQPPTRVSAKQESSDDYNENDLDELLLNMTSLTVTLPTSWSYTRRYNNATSLYYGPLLMALNFPYSVKTLATYAFNSKDLAFLPNGTWNYAINILDWTDLPSSLTIQARPIGQFPFDPITPPLYATAYGREIDWGTQHSNAAPPPQSPVNSTNPLVPISLIPFGASMLRIAEIPVLVQSTLQPTHNQPRHQSHSQ